VSLQIIECDQGTPEWYRARLGLPTASMFATILAKGKDGGASVTRRTYLNKLAGEIFTGEPAENYTNGHMERGQAMEAEARNFYCFMHDAVPQRVGFIVNGNKGCSPDSLLASDGVLEIKTKMAHLAIECILRDEFPAEHKAQCQGALWVAEREWIDIAVYWPKLPLFVKRAYRDEEYIRKLAQAVDQFNDELAATVEKLRRYWLSDQVAA
jgi:hypothetical protein